MPHRAAVGFALLMLLTPAAVLSASVDSTFDGFLNLIEAWLTGSLGKVLVIVCLGVGMGLAVVKQSQIARFFAVVTALAATFGPGIITGIFSATL